MTSSSAALSSTPPAVQGATGLTAAALAENNRRLDGKCSLFGLCCPGSPDDDNLGDASSVSSMSGFGPAGTGAGERGPAEGHREIVETSAEHSANIRRDVCARGIQTVSAMPVLGGLLAFSSAARANTLSEVVGRGFGGIMFKWLEIPFPLFEALISVLIPSTNIDRQSVLKSAFRLFVDGIILIPLYLAAMAIRADISGWDAFRKDSRAILADTDVLFCTIAMFDLTIFFAALFRSFLKDPREGTSLQGAPLPAIAPPLQDSEAPADERIPLLLSEAEPSSGFGQLRSSLPARGSQVWATFKSASPRFLFAAAMTAAMFSADPKKLIPIIPNRVLTCFAFKGIVLFVDFIAYVISKTGLSKSPGGPKHFATSIFELALYPAIYYLACQIPYSRGFDMKTEAEVFTEKSLNGPIPYSWLFFMFPALFTQLVINKVYRSGEPSAPTGAGSTGRLSEVSMRTAGGDPLATPRGELDGVSP